MKIRFASPFLSLLVLLSASGARAELIYGALDGGSLVRFDSASPSGLMTIGGFGGLLGNQQVRAIDFRPATRSPRRAPRRSCTRWISGPPRSRRSGAGSR